jgi:hypothetical protein
MGKNVYTHTSKIKLKKKEQTNDANSKSFAFFTEHLGIIHSIRSPNITQNN